MLTYFSPSTCFLYRMDVYEGVVPEDAVSVSDEEYAGLQAGISARKILVPGPDGRPLLQDPPVVPPTVSQLCSLIDATADAARLAVAGDPLRAAEYEKAAAEAKVFRDAGYPVDAVPRTVAAWAINGRTAQQAADNILAEAAAYNEALYQIREARLGAKEQVRQAMAANQVEQARLIASATIDSIRAAITGIGNAGA